MPNDERVAATRGDGGAILLIVLFVTTMLAVVIGVVLTNVEVNLRNTEVTKNLDDKTYAADGGVEYVIQRLRQDANACSNPSLSPWQQNNTTVVVSCIPGPGGAAPGSGWAVNVSASLSTSFGIAGTTINGATYVGGGISLSSGLSLTGGLLFWAQPPCIALPLLGGLLPTCTSTPVAPAQAALPGAAFTFANRGPAPSYTIGADCNIFLPGKYTAAPVLGAHNYFASGIYYFENVGTINVDGLDLFGGNPRAPEVALVDQAPACADDTLAGVSDGSGVEWILGGTSAISVGSTPGTSFELFARQPGASTAEGTPGVSIRNVPNATAGYVQSAPTGDIFRNTGGPGTQVVVHGMVYTPNADVTVSATGNTTPTTAELAGGVVARTLVLNSSLLLGAKVLVSITPTTGGHQFFTIKSTALGGATKDVTTTAVIELSNDADRTAVIDSWATNAA